jgi:hypothetical protein
MIASPGAPLRIAAYWPDAYPRWGPRFGADSHPGSNAA